MPEWLKDLIVAVGGGTVVLIGVLTIFKNLLIKLFETGIESSFEKSLEMYRNKLSRSTKAYEMLLDREMRFYERIEPIYAELVPLEHDLLYYLKKDEFFERKDGCEAFRKHFVRYTELIKVLKNETLIHQSFIPSTVFSASTAVVAQMQQDIHYWFDMCELLFASEYEKIDYQKGEEIVDVLLMKLAAAEMSVKLRLEELSKLS